MFSVNDYSGRINFMAESAVAVAFHGRGDEIDRLRFVTKMGNLYEDSLKIKDEEELKKYVRKWTKFKEILCRICHFL